MWLDFRKCATLSVIIFYDLILTYTIMEFLGNENMKSK